MKLYQLIKNFREEKKLSQEYIASELDLSQSQYSRREKGEIKFLADEVISLSKILKVSVSVLLGESDDLHYVGSRNLTIEQQRFLISEKLTEQYEARLKEKDELIQMLKRNV